MLRCIWNFYEHKITSSPKLILIALEHNSWRKSAFPSFHSLKRARVQGHPHDLNSCIVYSEAAKVIQPATFEVRLSLIFLISLDNWWKMPGDQEFEHPRGVFRVFFLDDVIRYLKIRHIWLYNFIIRIKMVRNIILNDIEIHDQSSRMYRLVTSSPRSR